MVVFLNGGGGDIVLAVHVHGDVVVVDAIVGRESFVPKGESREDKVWEIAGREEEEGNSWRAHTAGAGRGSVGSQQGQTKSFTIIIVVVRSHFVSVCVGFFGGGRGMFIPK